MDEADKILGLELGADDYVTKPFSLRGMVARVKAVLRRRKKEIASSGSKKIKIGDHIIIDSERFQVLMEGKEIFLTSTEFKILQLLASKQGWVFDREQILNYLCGDEKAVFDRTVDVHIRNLREELKEKGHL
jgi:DNA-binding response OmpR family regulator